MSAYWIGLIIGGFLVTGIMSRITLALLGKVSDKRLRIYSAHGLSIIASTIFGVLGLADGRPLTPPMFLFVFAVYAPPQLVWMAVDLRRLSRREGAAL